MKTILNILKNLVFILFIFLCIFVALLCFDFFKNKTPEKYRTFQNTVYAKLKPIYNRVLKGNTDYLSVIKDIVSDQKRVDSILLYEMEQDYSFDNPCIVINPYGTSPLTAVVIFSTEKSCKVSIKIEGKTNLADVEYNNNQFENKHIVPVYGLYENSENKIQLTIEDEEGIIRTKELSIKTDLLPQTYKRIEVSAHLINADEYQGGFTFTTLGLNGMSQKSAIDVNGDYRWLFDQEKYFKNTEDCLHVEYRKENDEAESFFVSVGAREQAGETYILEFNFLGKLLSVYYSDYGVHHDIEVTSDALYLTGSEFNEIKEALVTRINKETGVTEMKINYADILQITRNQTKDESQSAYYSTSDWCHLNSVKVDVDGSIIVSTRNQSTIISSDATGKINWMLCDPEGYYDYYRQLIVKPVGEDFVYPSCQHYANILPDQDNDPNTIDILTFDNGSLREEPVSQIIQYRIDKTKMTVEVVWRFGGDRPELYSEIRGSSELLQNNNRLASFEPKDTITGITSSYIVEVDADKNVVWECWRVGKTLTDSCYEYRVDRFDIYSDKDFATEIGEEVRFLFDVEGTK